MGRRYVLALVNQSAVNPRIKSRSSDSQVYSTLVVWDRFQSFFAELTVLSKEISIWEIIGISIHSVFF